MKKNIYTLLFLLLATFTFSQAKKKKATLLFRDGTQLSCMARISGENIRYVENDTRAKEIVVDEKELNGIKIWMNDNLVELYFKTEEGKTKPKLMELVNNGKMKLFRISNVNEKNIGFSYNSNYFEKSASTVYFLEKKSNKDLVFRIAKNFDETAKDYFSDCSSLVERIGQDNFRKKDISKIVVFYNENCGVAK